MEESDFNLDEIKQRQLRNFPQWSTWLRKRSIRPYYANGGFRDITFRYDWL
jgi:hypothetical protein